MHDVHVNVIPGQARKWYFDKKRIGVHRNGCFFPLPKHAARVLSYFLQHPNEIISYEFIGNIAFEVGVLWGTHQEVYHLVHQIRLAIGDTHPPTVVVARRDLGYEYRPTTDDTIACGGLSHEY